MKMVAEAYKVQLSGNIHVALYCIEADGSIIRPVTNTLLDAISEMHSSEIATIEELLLKAESGTYTPENPNIPDWNVNDKFFWLGRPEIENGHFLVSNELIVEFSSEFGKPQMFLIEQFRVALKFWADYQALLVTNGKENMLGKRVHGTL